MAKPPTPTLLNLPKFPTYISREQSRTMHLPVVLLMLSCTFCAGLSIQTPWSATTDHERPRSVPRVHGEYGHHDKWNPSSRTSLDPHALRDRTIVYIGDSTTRYEYLTLAYFAEYGEWPLQESIRYGRNGATGKCPNILWEKNDFVSLPLSNGGDGKCPASSQSWAAFYEYSNRVFNGKEACDAWRAQHCCTGDQDVQENRIYADPGRNLKIMYFQWFAGVNHPHGLGSLEEFISGNSVCQAGTGGPHAVNTSRWNYHITKFLGQVMHLVGNADVFVQAGHHSAKDMSKDWGHLAVNGATASRKTGNRVYWRTSFGSHFRQGYFPGFPASADFFLSQGWRLYDSAGIVVRLDRPTKTKTFDDKHLTYHANVWVVEEMLRQLLSGAQDIVAP